MKVDVAELYHDLPFKMVAIAPPPLVAGDDDLDSAMPQEMRNWLVQLRLLDGVPFANLVADTELLPGESIRWFYLDRQWTDALVQGALSVGTVNSDDRTQLTANYPAIRDELDNEERNVRRAAGSPRFDGKVDAISGFVLRSEAVSGWPGLHVRAFNVDPAEGDNAHYTEDDPRRMRLLRLERLAPAVLFCLFDGIPTVVHIEEPRQGVQFGFDEQPNDERTLKPRNKDTFQDLNVPPVTVPFRSGTGTAGVVDIQELERRLAQLPNTGAVDGLDAAEVRAAAHPLPLPPGLGRRARPPDRKGLPTDVVVCRPREDLPHPDGPAMNIAYNEQAIGAAAASDRWAALVKLDLDVATLGTWDRSLPRDKRILVPIDVQAMVVPTGDAEATVPITGTRDDPEPFAVGGPRAAGVHLHWAMPDALLRGTHDEAASALVMPALPDRWVVVRTLLPEGGRLVHVKGWIVDAAKGSVTALDGFDGTTADAPADTPSFVPLDGQSGGTLMWTATYEGARDRFTLHDDLSDLDKLKEVAPDGFHAGRAVYTVAGWWTDAGHDPLAACRSRAELNDTVRSFGWHISPEADDDADRSEDPRMAKLRASAGLSSPAASTPMIQVDKYRTTRTVFSDIAPTAAAAVGAAALRYVGAGATHYHALLHGSVLGVPITGVVTAADDRPATEVMTTAVGLDLDDVTAALAAPAFGTTPDRRTAAERLMAALTSGLLARIATPDGVSDIEEHEHADGFWSFAGPALVGVVDDRLRAEDSIPLGPTAVGRKGRGAMANAGGLATGRGVEALGLATELSWTNEYVTMRSGASIATTQQQPSVGRITDRPPLAKPGSSRTVPKPPPRLFRPAPAIVAVRDLKPNARHHGDGLFDPEGLRCRWPGECRPGFQGVVDPAALVPTLGSGAIPDEVIVVVREAVTLDPYSGIWLAHAGQPEVTWPAREARIAAEHIRLYGANMTYDGSGATALIDHLSGPQAAASSWATSNIDHRYSATQVSVELANFSYIGGATPSPVALTTWRQPWVPLYVEWKVRAVGRDTLEGWSLEGLDLVAGADAPPPDSIDRTFIGRSPITVGIAKSLSGAMKTWIDAENARDAATPSQSQLSDSDESTCSRSCATSWPRSTSSRRRSTASASNCSASSTCRAPSCVRSSR